MKTKQQKKVSFEKIKSHYFILRIFVHMKKNKLLEIVKNNKKMQKQLNLNLNDYKEYSQLYTPIEMEIKFEEGKFGNFIKIPDKDKKYYHIYFDNSKEDIKRDFTKYNEKVKVVKIIIDYQVKSFLKNYLIGVKILEQ